MESVGEQVEEQREENYDIGKTIPEAKRLNETRWRFGTVISVLLNGADNLKHFLNDDLLIFVFLLYQTMRLAKAQCTLHPCHPFL